MPVNQTLASFSDMAYVSAFVIYALALTLAVVYYTRQRTIIDDQREVEFLQNTTRKQRQYAHAGTPASSTDIGGDQASDISRIRERLAKNEATADKLAGITQSLIWLGIIVHGVSAVLRGLSAGRFPFGNLYEYVLVVTFGFMVAAGLALQRPQMRALWPWVLAPVLALLFFGGTKLYSESAPVVPALQSFWYPIHVSTVSIGGSIGMLSGVASILYLLRMWQPAGKEKGFFGGVAKPLPSAKTLDNIAYKTAIITLPLFGLGVVLGAIWAEAAWGRFWGWDPKETLAFISWILYAAYLHARATAGWRDWRAALINVLALVSMIFNLFFINMVISGLHSYAGLN